MKDEFADFEPVAVADEFAGDEFAPIDSAPSRKYTPAELQERLRLQRQLKADLAASDAADEHLADVEGTAEMARPFLRGAVDLADGVLSLPRLLASAPVAAYNFLTGSKAQLPISQSVADIAPGARNVLAARDDYEQLASTITRGLGGVLGGVGIGGAIGAAGGAGSTVANVGRTLAANPGLQTAGAVTGGIASEAARQAGGGPVSQLVAGLAGGAAPSLLQAGLSGATRLALRGGEQGRAGVEQSLDDFGRAGTTPSVGQATQNRFLQAGETLLSRIPGSAGRIASKAETQADEIGAGIEATAGRLAGRTSAEDAGRTIISGVKGPGGFVERTKGIQQQLYDELDNHIGSESPTAVTNTQKALAELTEVNPGAAATTARLINPKIKQISDDLATDTGTRPVATPRTDVVFDRSTVGRGAPVGANAEVVDVNPSALIKAHRATDPNYAKYNKVESVSDFAKRGNRLSLPEADVVNGKLAFTNGRNRAKLAEEAGLPTIPVAVTKGTGQAFKDFVSQYEGTVPYSALKDLRTRVGEQLESGLVSEVPAKQLKRLYGAISEDLKEAARKSGPDAELAWSRANNYTRDRMSKLGLLDEVIQKEAKPEDVYRAAVSGTAEGATRLRTVMESLPPEAQKVLSATVLRRLGRAINSQQDDLGEKFSTETFLTNWSKLSPEAKSTLFDRFGTQYRRDVDALSKVASNLRDGSKIFKNPSGTAQGGAQIATASAATAALGALAHGNALPAIGLGSALAGANLAARLMTNPNFVRWLAVSTKLPASVYTSQLNQLQRIGERKGDPLLIEAVQYLKEQGGKADYAADQQRNSNERAQ